MFDPIIKLGGGGELIKAYKGVHEKRNNRKGNGKEKKGGLKFECMQITVVLASDC